VTYRQTSKTFLARVGEFTYRRRGLVLLAWVLGLVIAFAASSKLAGDWSANYETPGSESEAALNRLDERFPERRPYNVDVVWQAKDAASPEIRSRIDEFLSRAQRLEGMTSGITTETAQVSADGTIGLARIPLDARSTEDVPVETGERIIELARATDGDGLRIELGGLVIGNAEEGEVSSEMVGLMVAAVVLLLTFGSLIAAGMPLATALFGLGISSALGGILAAVIDVPDWAPAVAAMIGIGVGIDYALLIVTRFRAGLERGLDPREATAEAVATAGRSVLVAGTTVVISMMGLFLMGLTYLHGVAISAIIAVLVVMAASVTLLPALLGFARQRVNRLRLPGVARGRAGEGSVRAIRWSRLVQRRPLAAAIAGTAVLLALAAPVTGLRLAFPDAGNDRAETTTRQAYDLTAKGFGAGSAGPLVLVASLAQDGDRAALAELAKQIGRDDGVARVDQPLVNRSGDTGVVSVVPTSAPQDADTAQLLERLRDDVVPQSGLDANIGGTTASLSDQSALTYQRLPLFIGGVVGLSFLLLVAAFRAPLVAVKAGLLNVLSIGAAYGIVAVVADGGFIGGLVGIDTATPVPPFIPVMMFAILFGLSMDYEVFLLSRIREEYLATGSTSTAVVEGLARTARVITAAAAIMVAVFAAFVLSGEVFTKLIGIGLAAAVLIDATVVRMVLVPAVMQLLGERNWWLPSWLDRSMPQLELEAQPAATR
jgi:putative drug exporter of the RND superfamily